MPVYSNWGKSRLVLAVEDVPFCNDKIDPGAPLMVPEAEIETSGGYRDNGLFPCGMIKKGENVRIFYNAGDAVVCLAECNIKELVALCKDKKKFIKFAFM